MASASKTRDPLPSRFRNAQEAGDFWDTHDFGDYWDQTSEAQFEVDIQSHRFLTALEPELAKRLLERARERGVSTETLINVWLAEKLDSAS